jgi:hypothetical protein
MENKELEKALSTIETLKAALKKSGDAVAAHFKAAAAHHDGLHKAHMSAHALHKAHGEFVKAKADAMEDGSTEKTYFGKVAEHHMAKAEHHKAVAEIHKAEAERLTKAGDGSFTGDMTAGDTTHTDGTPGSLGEAGKGMSVEDMVKQTTSGLVKKSLEMLKSDPTVQDEIRTLVLQGVKSALGQETVPTMAKLFPTSDVPESEIAKGLKLIQRPGSAPINTDEVDPKLADMVGE